MRMLRRRISPLGCPPYFREVRARQVSVVQRAELPERRAKLPDIVLRVVDVSARARGAVFGPERLHRGLGAEETAPYRYPLLVQEQRDIVRLRLPEPEGIQRPVPLARVRPVYRRPGALERLAHLAGEAPLMRLHGFHPQCPEIAAGGLEPYHPAVMLDPRLEPRLVGHQLSASLQADRLDGPAAAHQRLELPDEAVPHDEGSDAAGAEHLVAGETDEISVAGIRAVVRDSLGPVDAYQRACIVSHLRDAPDVLAGAGRVVPAVGDHQGGIPAYCILPALHWHRAGRVASEDL